MEVAPAAGDHCCMMQKDGLHDLGMILYLKMLLCYQHISTLPAVNTYSLPDGILCVCDSTPFDV